MPILQLRSSEISEDEKTSLTHSLLLPLGQSLVVNRTEGNRREAGVALSHISGSGEESSRLISELCQLLKQVVGILCDFKYLFQKYIIIYT